MLGRAANDLFWLSRYLERAENMARLVEVGYRLGLVPGHRSGGHNDWRSTLQSAGCEAGYAEKHDKITTRDVVNFLVFDPDNPSSIRTSLETARRNARAQRTALTREMWESINSSWIEFQTLRPENLTSDEIGKTLDWIKERSAAYRGALLNTILRNHTFFFSQLGTFLERADNTARILDVKYYVLLPRPEMVGSGIDNMQWAAILRSVSAHRSYRWVYKESYKPWRIADYLILNQAMPRSLHACYLELVSSLDALSRIHGEEQTCNTTARQTLALFTEGNIDRIFQSGLHEFLQDFIARNNRLGAEIAEAYHFNE